MKVINVHSRVIRQPLKKVGWLLDTLSTKEDRLWPSEKWPRMKFKDGLIKGAKGGHGPIRYSISQYEESKFIEFTFSQPKGFSGKHFLNIESIDKNTTKIVHTIEMQTKGLGTLKWLFFVKQLHNALLEDALDKAENQFSNQNISSEYSIYVKFLRWILKQL